MSYTDKLSDEISTGMRAPPNARLHYFDLDEADPSDMLLGMAKMQGYVPDTCLLGGASVMNEVQRHIDPCAGCNGPREKCKGRPKPKGNFFAR